MPDSSLSSVVSDLVRAQMGSSVSGTVTDADLDRHIGEIILREAKAKAERYKTEGIRAYLPKSDANVPRTNKRFLSSIIRSTDDHNKAILRSQAEAAAELKQEREEQERRERMARAEEAARERRLRMRGRLRGSGEAHWRPEMDKGKRRDGKKRDWEKVYDDDDDEDLGSRSRSRSRTQSRSPVERKRYWDEDEDEYEERRNALAYKSRDADRHRRRRHRDYSMTRSRTLSHSRSRSRPSPPKREKRKRKEKEEVSGSSSREKTNLNDNTGRRDRNGESSRREKTSTRHRDRDRSSRHTKSSSRRGERNRTRSIPPSPRESKKQCRVSPSLTPGPELPAEDIFSPVRHRSPHSRPPSPLSKPPPMPPSDRPPSPTAKRPPSPEHKRPPSPSPPLEPPSRSPSPLLHSKMDKYFSSTYDPRLDVAPLTSIRSSSSAMTIDVPATGLVDNAQFEGWDAMLELIRLRREDRVEKKRLERLGLLPEKDKDKVRGKGLEGRGKKGQGMVSAVAEEGKGIMDIKYAKKGAVREWDMGKEVV